MSGIERIACACGWSVEDVTLHAAKIAAVWHVYEEHPESWLAVVGDRPPKDPDPRTPQGRQQVLADLS